MCRCSFFKGNVGVGTKDRPLFNNSSSSWENVILLKLCIVRAVVVDWRGSRVKKDLVCFVCLLVGLELGISFLAVSSCGGWWVE